MHTQIKKSPTISFASFITVLILLASLILLTTLVLAIKKEGNATALKSGKTLFIEISTKTIARVNVELASISTLTDTAALVFKYDKTFAPETQFSDNINFMKTMLEENSWLLSVYIGYETSAFHQLIATRQNQAIIENYGAPAGAAYIDRTITVTPSGKRHQKWCFLDPQLNALSHRIDALVSYDPRQRPWYKQAQKAGQSIFTDPYIFSSSRLPGLTCARVLADNNGVFGADITLTRLGHLLETQKISENGRIWILNDKNRLAAYPGLVWDGIIGDKLQLPDATKAPEPFVQAVVHRMEMIGPNVLDETFFLETNNTVYMGKATSMDSIFAGAGPKLTVVVAAPLKDITGHIDSMVIRIFLLSACLLALIIPISLWIGRRMAYPVEKLAQKAKNIQHFDFSSSSPISSFLREIQGLSVACEVMKNTIRIKTEDLEHTQHKLENLVQGGIALGEVTELAKLVTSILETSKELADADGGVIYIFENDKLGVELLSLGNESLVLGGLSNNPAPRVMIRPDILPFLDQDAVLRATCKAFNTREIVVNQDGNFTLFPTGLPEEPKNYLIHSVITVPIVTSHDDLLGVIQLFNSDLKSPDKTCQFVSALAAQAAVTLENRNLVNSLRELFNSLVQVIATSIDAKSPYTAGHCTRVPAICEMLTRTVHETADGPYANFYIETEEEWRQLNIAAWLHDCGKVCTPEFVVDKATKLETIYNRIHEVRMRFEVLRRDAEIEYYQRCLDGNSDLDILRKKLDKNIRELEEEFAFVAKFNIGGEFMSKDAQKRLKSIAQRTWKRHFSNRLGISNEEQRRIGDVPEPQLPELEPLLADKAEHLFPRVKDYSHIKDAQNEPLLTPEYEYNKGELYNLCIERGTLTAEERFKINEHTLIGLEMLNKIPFPKNLSKVPEIAIGHHETLVRTGYPLKKDKGQLMVETRILAIADIFEALTASDRPYKNPKSVSEALKIMGFMRNDQHIDPDLFDIFLKSGVFKKYGAKYLAPSQNDVEDISPYLNNNN